MIQYHTNVCLSGFHWILVCGKFSLGDCAVQRFRRFSFAGGNNITLRGSTDPKWGWVDGHGQAAGVFPRGI
jgi:hypothetical protein